MIERETYADPLDAAAARTDRENAALIQAQVNNVSGEPVTVCRDCGGAIEAKRIQFARKSHLRVTRCFECQSDYETRSSRFASRH
jgi:RNA polymerase-binding transcription factor DksA